MQKEQAKMKVIHFLNLHPRLVISVTAVGITLMVGMVAYHIMRIYQTIQPIWVEQAAYGQAPMVAFLALIKKDGIWFALSQMRTERHLLQLLVLGLLAPTSLGWFHAPLLAVMPTFIAFLGLFGWTIYKRIGHLGYSAAAMLLFCTFAQFTRHSWGIGSGFADWQSMFLLSAAILSLINALIKPGLGWIRSFSIFIALAVLARTTSTFYAAVLCGPILLLYLIHQYQSEHSFKTLGITLINILVIIAPSATVVIGQLPRMFLYYGSVNAWNLHQPIVASGANIFFRLLTPFFGFPLILICIILFVLHILRITLNKSLIIARVGLVAAGFGIVFLSYVLTYVSLDQPLPDYLNIFLLALGFIFFAGAHALTKTEVVDWVSIQNELVGKLFGKPEIAILWWGLGYLSFLLLNGYTSDVPKEVMYIAPAVLLGSLAPVSVSNQKNTAFYTTLTIGLTAFSIICFGWYSYQNAGFARVINPEQNAIKLVQNDMARSLSALPVEIKWQSFTNIDWGIPVSLITQYEFGKYRQYGGVNFYNKKEYWDTWYSNLSLSELQHELYVQTLNCVDVAVILKNPDQQPSGMEDYSYSIAAYIAHNVKADSNWSLVSSLAGWPINTQYQIYLNTTPSSSLNCQK